MTTQNVWSIREGNLLGSIPIWQDADADHSEPYSAPSPAALPRTPDVGATLFEAMPPGSGLAVGVGLSLLMWIILIGTLFLVSR